MTTQAPDRELVDLPDLAAEIPCQARIHPAPAPGAGATGRKCGATPVTHEVQFACTRGCPGDRYFVCATHAAVARGLWPDGLALDLRCGDPKATVVVVPAGGAA